MKVLIRGLGGVGQRHIRNIFSHLDNIRLFTDTKRTFVPEINNDLTLDASKDFLKLYGATVISDEVIKSSHFDLTVIASPSSFHFSQASIAIENSEKVFVEKPVCLDSEQVLNLQQKALRYGTIVAVCSQWRYTRLIRRVKEILNSGVLGKLVFVSSLVSEYMPDWHKYEDYRKSYASRSDLGGGVIATQIHEIDILFYLLGDLEVLSAIGGNTETLDIDVEDLAVTTLIQNSGDRCNVLLRQDYLGRPPKRSLELIGKRGKLEICLREKKMTISFFDQQELITEYDKEDRNVAFERQMIELLNSSRISEQPGVTLEEARSVVTIMNQIKSKLNA